MARMAKGYELAAEEIALIILPFLFAGCHGRVLIQIPSIDPFKKLSP